ncbi:MAG: virulence RhuM family protein, partial [Micrococcales bacterium]|nr:virulence RhuM family protein [Micrococcales bacterium]MCL2668030.1 virulence RhuM family protein [Micrococcales bacterium]
MAIYQDADRSIRIEVHTDSETVWLNRQQMATLFGRDVKTIGKHVASARREELAGFSTVAKIATVQTEGSRTVQRDVEHYNLDVVLSVGYRVKSPEGVRFRRWANEVLRAYLVDGAAVNARRLEQIGQTVRILARSSDDVIAGVANLLSRFSGGLGLLDAYDHRSLARPSHQTASTWQLTYDDARHLIDEMGYGE